MAFFKIIFLKNGQNSNIKGSSFQVIYEKGKEYLQMYITI